MIDSVKPINLPYDCNAAISWFKKLRLLSNKNLVIPACAVQSAFGLYRFTTFLNLNENGNKKDILRIRTEFGDTSYLSVFSPNAGKYEPE